MICKTIFSVKTLNIPTIWLNWAISNYLRMLSFRDSFGLFQRITRHCIPSNANYRINKTSKNHEPQNMSVIHQYSLHRKDHWISVAPHCCVLSYDQAWQYVLVFARWHVCTTKANFIWSERLPLKGCHFQWEDACQ